MRDQVEKILEFLKKYYKLPELKEEDFLEDIRLCLHGVGKYITVREEADFISVLESLRKFSNLKDDKDYHQEIDLYSSYQLYCKLNKAFLISSNVCDNLNKFYKVLSNFFKKYPNIVLVNRPVFEYKDRNYNVSTYNINFEKFVEENKDKLVFLYPDIENNNLTWNNNTQVRAVVIE